MNRKSKVVLFIKGLVTHPPKSIRVTAGTAIAVVALIPIGRQLYIHQAEVGTYLANINARMLYAAWGLAVLDLGILASTWLLIANRLGIALGFAQDLRAFFFSNFAKRVPGMVWYVAGRAYLYRAGEDGIWMATTGTILENALLLLAGLLLALVIWPRQLGLDNSWMFAAFLVSVSMALVFSLWPTAMLQLVHAFRRTFRKESTIPVRTVRLATKDTLIWIVLYVLVWVVGGVSFHCLAAAFYPSLSVASLPFTLGVTTAYSLSGFVAFFVPAGMGIKELTGAYLLSRVLPTPLAVVVVLLFRSNLLLAEGFWLVLSHFLERYTRLSPHNPKRLLL